LTIKFFFGKLEGIKDLVTLEGQIEKEFKEAIDDYIDLLYKTSSNYE